MQYINSIYKTTRNVFAQSVGRTQVKMSEIETGSETPLETNSVDKIKLEHHHLKAFDRFYCLEHAFILLYTQLGKYS